ncbi:MAG: dockerin type I domain-containing protein [Phycisphaerales bacterium]|nr:dockerin type I domain-containing protein [Phycisphaerales bacterium]MCI0676574.1 dockerin type I domain-containing protein [Phycisphaerales bacterium]
MSSTRIPLTHRLNLAISLSTATMLASVLVSDAGYAQVLYTVEELTAFNGPVNEAYDISPDGQAVGRVLDPFLVAKATSWERGVVTNLGTNGEARGISSNGLIAGSIGSLGQIWTNGVPTALNVLPNHIGTRGWDVNSGGLVAGWSVNNVGDPTAATWLNGVVTALDVNHSWAFRINDAGQIVGRRDVSTGREARLWHNGTGVTLEHFGNNYASATNITPRGIITGGACQPVGPPGVCQPREVIWLGPDHDLQVLPMFPSALLEALWNANDRGVFVGEYAFDIDGATLRALIWRWPDFEPIDLNTLIAPESGWILQSAQSINHDGTIAGYGIRPGLSGRRAFLLQPINTADVTDDAVVNVADLLAVISAWGQCADAIPCPADLSGDGMVNVVDLLELISQWG